MYIEISLCIIIEILNIFEHYLIYIYIYIIWQQKYWRLYDVYICICIYSIYILLYIERERGPPVIWKSLVHFVPFSIFLIFLQQFANFGPTLWELDLKEKVQGKLNRSLFNLLNLICSNYKSSRISNMALVGYLPSAKLT